MSREMISISKAQETAEKQSESAKIPLANKAFTYNEVEVDIIAIIKNRGLSQTQIEMICNLEINSTFTTYINTSYSVIKRVK